MLWVMGLLTLSLDMDIAVVRLAGEGGVPLPVIARATKISSDVLRSTLRKAQLEGRLLRLPRDEWPPSFKQQVGVGAEVDDAFKVAARRVFGLTPNEICVLHLLMAGRPLNKSRIDGMTPRTIDVHICKMRRQLQAHGIEIGTVRGSGYCLSEAARQKIARLIQS
jgi:hypothetical protein